MILLFEICLAGVLAAVLLFISPLLRAKQATLPVLLISQVEAQAHTNSRSAGLSQARLAALLARLKTTGFTPLLPRDLARSPQVQHPVLLLFTGGYQSFFTDVYPLLEKYQAKAAVALSAGLIGQYNAWQSAQKGPWQNLLTAAQIQQLQRSNRVEFVSSTLDGTAANGEDTENISWKLLENKTRLQQLYKLKPLALYFPFENPQRPAVLQTARNHFSLLIGNQPGNNLLPLSADELLCVFPVTHRTCLRRLMWKMARR